MRLRELAGGLVAAVVMAAFAGCGSGGSPSGVTAAAYVKSVCNAVAPFQGDVVKRSNELNATNFATAADGKKAIQGFLSAVATDTDRSVSKLKAAGTPAVTGGERVASDLVSAFKRLRSTIHHALKQANALPTDNPESFQKAANSLGKTVQTSISGIGGSLSQLRSPELDKAAANEPACRSLGGAAAL